ncbi:MAG TPA: hypothetical protein VIC62_04805 [Nakamurella sp.]|jgi:hypothetical protein
MTNGRQLRRLSVTVLGGLTLTFAGLQLWGGTDAPAAVPDDGATASTAVPVSTVPASSATATSATVTSATATPGPPESAISASSTESRPPGTVTIAFAGDVNFAERTADRLAGDPSTVFGPLRVWPPPT